MTVIGGMAFCSLWLLTMTDQTHPPYLRISMNLLTIALLITGLYLGRGIVVPFFFAVLLSMVLNPMVGFLTRHRIDRVLSIILCLILALGIIFGILYFLSTQIGGFLEDIPVLKQRMAEVMGNVKEWVHDNFNIGIREQNKYLKETTSKMTNENGGVFVVQTFVTLTELVSYLIFLPVYTFLLIYHKDMIITFLTEIFKQNEERKVVEVLYEAQAISQQYIMGLMIETAIVFGLNSAGFLILGIKYPIFLAMVAALLNIVPYIGMLIANIFCVLITLVSSDPSINVIWVAVILSAVQIVDNNVLMPFIVGSKIKINALALILAVVIGGALCGIPGMFLAVPGLAMMKVVFERVDSLKPWSLLLSDQTSQMREKKNPLKHAVTKARDKVKKD